MYFILNSIDRLSLYVINRAKCFCCTKKYVISFLAAVGKCRNAVNIAIVLDGSVQEEAKAKKVRSFVKQISQSFNIGIISAKDGNLHKSTFSVGIFNAGLSLHVPIDKVISNVRFESFLDSLKMTSAALNIITDYNKLFDDNYDYDRIKENVLLTVEDYGSTHSAAFSKMVSALEKTTKVSSEGYLKVIILHNINLICFEILNF